MKKKKIKIEREAEEVESGEPGEPGEGPGTGGQELFPAAAAGADEGPEERAARAEQECEAWKDRVLRLQAEFENYRKRQARERQEQQRSAGEKIIGALLPVLDNLERAVAHAESSDQASLLEGVRLVVRQMRELLESHGVETVASLGELFDPHLHEAMSRVETDGEPPDGTVVEEYRKGYLLKGKVLRPAMVSVAKLVDETDEGQEA